MKTAADLLFISVHFIQVLSVLLIIISLKNDMLFAPIQVSFLLMLIELIRKNKIDNMADRLKYQEFKLLGEKWV